MPDQSTDGPKSCRDGTGPAGGNFGTVSVRPSARPWTVSGSTCDDPWIVPGTPRRSRTVPGPSWDRTGNIAEQSLDRPGISPGRFRSADRPRIARNNSWTALDNPGTVAGLSPDRPGIVPMQSLDRPGIIPARSRDCLRMIPGPSRDSPWNAKGHHLPPKPSATSNSVQLSPRLNPTP